MARCARGGDGKDDKVIRGKACIGEEGHQSQASFADGNRPSSPSKDRERSSRTWPILQDIVSRVTVHTAPHHLNEPLYAVDEIGKDFIETVLGWDMNEFCLKYESFALFRIKGIAMNGNDRAVMIRRRIRGSVVRGLREITGNPALDMSWKNYEENIVDQYRVVLDGWPSSVFDPAKLGYKGLQTILDELEDRSCKWCRLTDDEFTARGKNNKLKPMPQV
ncbi:hypothetical protein K439DRAFT_1620079 [Ramaria rubella]|nr:hypothetical protein K439DRAFT_1620079 [Ramaria rubella]